MSKLDIGAFERSIGYLLRCIFAASRIKRSVSAFFLNATPRFAQKSAAQLLSSQPHLRLRGGGNRKINHE